MQISYIHGYMIKCTSQKIITLKLFYAEYKQDYVDYMLHEVFTLKASS